MTGKVKKAYYPRFTDVTGNRTYGDPILLTETEFTERVNSMTNLLRDSHSTDTAIYSHKRLFGEDAWAINMRHVVKAELVRVRWWWQ